MTVFSEHPHVKCQACQEWRASVAKLVAEEREACAQIAESDGCCYWDDCGHDRNQGQHFDMCRLSAAAEIRART